MPPRCPNCTTPLTSSSDLCPGCGLRVRQKGGAKGLIFTLLLLLVAYATFDRWSGSLERLTENVDALSLPGTFSINSYELTPNPHVTRRMKEVTRRETQLVESLKNKRYTPLDSIKDIEQRYEELMEYRPMDERLRLKREHYAQLIRRFTDEGREDRRAFGPEPGRLTPALPYDAVSDYLAGKIKGRNAELLFEECSKLYARANRGWFVNCRWKTVDGAGDKSVTYHDWFLIRDEKVIGVEPVFSKQGTNRYRAGLSGRRVYRVE